MGFFWLFGNLAAGLDMKLIFFVVLLRVYIFAPLANQTQ
jgi:hypothetical protein